MTDICSRGEILSKGVDFSQLDSLKFESELKEKDFRILHYGKTDLGKMSDEFIYTAYENGQPVYTFPVGPSWENFTPLDSISPLLQMSVMQSEDGAFFYHRGFLPRPSRFSKSPLGNEPNNSSEGNQGFRTEAIKCHSFLPVLFPTRSAFKKDGRSVH